MNMFTQTLKTPLSDSATLTGYVQTPSPEMPNKEHRPAILVLPGGGYTMVSDREAEPVALMYAAHGFQAFVLRYSVLPAAWPSQLLEAAEAMKQIRAHADEWFLDPDQVATLGFSAGGHLAAGLATMADKPYLAQQGYDAKDIRANALLLGYAVTSLSLSAPAHGEPSQMEQAVLGANGKSAPLLKEATELGEQVTRQTPPTFLWATATDHVVPVRNSLLFADALAQAHVPFAIHIFPTGHHGLSLANVVTNGQGGTDVEPTVTPWVKLSLQWLQLQFPDAAISD
ncbi:alpha/beta hydrolase [Schleiferilactobacillus shenzhenensis]|uniref:BD-FAE-like domain-containing protein n=1 Tax=Schleiferilactobacillus shenzhenensis LY-73 TaxID=1231336 RepID=U4THX3_9LACO|nr:alpha/beta hydrolase [Schleiferilactobacillus shenzhenensis]ERL64376.1 hypothetical protein L248_1038 [Schleiferilactobacillus shenzhenensis LY-73]